MPDPAAPEPAPRPSIDAARCVLITGATSGLGRALALAIAQLPSHPTVVATGRRPARLAELGAVSGIAPVALELAGSLDTLKVAAADILARFPDLDTIILNAGIQHQVDLKADGDVMPKFLEELTVNYTAVVALITYFLPHFLKRSAEGRPSSIVTVTSGLGITPFPTVPNYSATKAALRSFTTSLRHQLVGTNVSVIEIIPPLVESEIHDAYGTTEVLSKIWMPLDEFTKVTMDGLKAGAEHIPVGSAVQSFNKFETGKEDIVNALLQRKR